MYKRIISGLLFFLLALWTSSCSDNNDEKDDEGMASMLVGLWSGEIGYTCSNGEHQGEKGTISFAGDGTGVLVETGEEPATFNYEVIVETKIVAFVFGDGRYGKLKYDELTNDRLTFVETCASCGNSVTMYLKRADSLHDITVSATEGYVESFLPYYDDQLRIQAIDYKLIDTDGEGDDAQGTVSVSYTPKTIHVENALLSDHTLYTVDFSLNYKGWAEKAVCTYRHTENDYSGTGTLNFTYDTNEHLKSISYSYSSTSSGTQSGRVEMTWSNNLMTTMKGAGDDYQADISYQTDKLPESSVNLPYFMMFRNDDDMVSCGGDNVILCYASLLNILGKAPHQLMSVLKNENDDGQNIFSFNYEWSNNRLARIYEHSSYNSDGSTGEDYDTQISFSYY